MALALRKEPRMKLAEAIFRALAGWRQGTDHQNPQHLAIVVECADGAEEFWYALELHGTCHEQDVPEFIAAG